MVVVDSVGTDPSEFGGRLLVNGGGTTSRGPHCHSAGPAFSPTNVSSCSCTPSLLVAYSCKANLSKAVYMALQNTILYCRYTVHRVECGAGGGIEGLAEVSLRTDSISGHVPG